MDLSLDRASTIPLYRQIAAELRRRIESGLLAPGVKLPASRELAEELGVNRTTITAAYKRLQDLGQVESGVGQGTFVRAGVARPHTAGRLSWESYLGSAHSDSVDGFHAPVTRNAIIMDRAVPDPDLYPADNFGEIIAELVAAGAKDLYSYGEAAGDDALRELIAERLAVRGISREENELLIVGGSQQGLDLVSRVMLRDGGTVVVDSPTYRGALEVFRMHRAEVIGLPMTPSGMDLDALEDLLARRTVRFIYAMPTLHNPTGFSLDGDGRMRLYDLARRHGTPIVEDDWLADLRTDADPAPLKALDDRGLVVHCGTFSKTAVPGFRVGWLSVPKELYPTLVEVKANSDLSTGVIGQRTLARFIADGTYDEHLAVVRTQYRKRMQKGLAALEEKMPAGVTWTHPEGGLVNWLELPEGVSGVELSEAAARRDLLVSPGELYVARSPGVGLVRGSLRLCYSLTKPARAAKGIALLAESLEEILERNRRGARASTAPPV